MRSNRWAVLAGVLAVCLAMGGCSKKKQAAGNGSDTPAAEAQSQPAPAPEAAPPPPAISSQPSRTLSESDAPYQVRDLQLSVDAYQKIYKRKPASVEQMVQEGFLASLPPAPPGKRYALDPSTAKVTIVSR